MPSFILPDINDKVKKGVAIFWYFKNNTFYQTKLIGFTFKTNYNFISL